jgi:hypothetical protein
MKHAREAVVDRRGREAAVAQPQPPRLDRRDSEEECEPGKCGSVPRRSGRQPTTISAESYLGGEPDFTITVVDRGTVGAGDLSLTIDLSSGMSLVGPPAVTRGSGCTGSSPIVCDLGLLGPRGAREATVMPGAQITKPADQRLTALARAEGGARSNAASYDVSIGR